MAFFRGLFDVSNTRYDQLSKKDCDYGFREIEAWKNRNKENPSLSLESLEQVDLYAKKIIKDLPVALTSSNMQPALEHLVTLAKQDDILREKLIKHVDDFYAEETIKREMRVKLICTTSKK